ncbi:extracellular solute-binding protein [Georgenia sp. MJ206]|uniref:ABC transporter substrate-binding protein n=1 Tax=Georgenia wangjunii TaxID=3117730 RepID=UPI002F26203C
MLQRSRRRSVVAGTVAMLALTACSTVASDSPDDVAAGVTTVTFRLWDEGALLAYEESFDAFSATHQDIVVEVEHVPRAEYLSRGAADLRTGDMADIFWTDASTLARHVDRGDVRSIEDVLGDHDEWEPAVADLFTRDGELWAVPQLWESVALFVRTDLATAAGVDPTALTWAPPRSLAATGPTEGTTPGGAGEGASTGAPPGRTGTEGPNGAGTDADMPDADGADADAAGPGDSGTDAPVPLPVDTLLPAATALTRDAAGRTPADEDFDPAATVQYGFNAEAAPAVYRPFLAQNGADEEGRPLLASSAGVEASQYLVDLVNVHHVAPPAEQTNADPTLTRELFAEGRLALFQSSSADLARVAEAATFGWEVAPPVAGPSGAVSAVDGVAAAVNADASSMDATLRVLAWLGSADGQAALAGQGVAFPAAVRAQQAYIDYWAARDVDVAPFVEAARGATVPARLASHVGPDAGELTPVLRDMLTGAVPVAAALTEAQATADASG